MTTKIFESNGSIQKQKTTLYPSAGDLFFFRLILTNRAGLKGFEDAKTVDGYLYPNYKEACIALNLLEGDNVAMDTMEEICMYTRNGSKSIRNVFCTMIFNEIIVDAFNIYTRFVDNMAQDFLYQRKKEAFDSSLTMNDEDRNKALNMIERNLKHHNVKWTLEGLGLGVEKIPYYKTLKTDKKAEVNIHIENQYYNRQECRDKYKKS